MMRRRPHMYLLSGLMFFLMLPTHADAAKAKLSWSPPTTRVDGTPISLSDIGGYKIYYGGLSGLYNGTGADQGDSPIDVPSSALADPAQPRYEVTGLNSCEFYYLAATAYDVYGSESDFSVEAAGTMLDKPVLAPSQSAGSGGMQISWSGLTATDRGIISNYYLYYDTDSGEPYQGVGAMQGTSPLVVAGNLLGMQLTGLVPDTVHYIMVEAACPDGTTSKSDELSGLSGGILPQPDMGVPPVVDAGGPPPPTPDTGVPPLPNDLGGVTPYRDVGPRVSNDAAPIGPPRPLTDGGVNPWVDSGAQNLTGRSSLVGGCAVAAAPSLWPLMLLLALALIRRRR